MRISQVGIHNVDSQRSSPYVCFYHFIMGTSFKPSVLFDRPSVLFVGPRQTAQGLHCLLVECSIKILNKNENYHQRPLKRKWTGPIDNSGIDSIRQKWVKRKKLALLSLKRSPHFKKGDI